MNQFSKIKKPKNPAERGLGDSTEQGITQLSLIMTLYQTVEPCQVSQ